MNPEGSRQEGARTPLAQDVVRLACASRSLLVTRPDLRDIGRPELAELTLQQVEREALPDEVLDAFDPSCAYFRKQIEAIPNQDGQRMLAVAEISFNRAHALPAALAGLALPPNCRAIAAEQLLALTDEPTKDFLKRVAGIKGR